MKKTIIASIAAFAIVSTSSANLGDVIIDSAIGGGIGAVIGNNTGDGDSETGAIIGAVSGGVAGWRNRTGEFSRGYGYGNNRNYYPQTMPHGHYGGNRNQPRVIYSDAPVYENVEIRRQVWVNEVLVRNAVGDIIHHVPGHYETRVEYRTIRVR